MELKPLTYNLVIQKRSLDGFVEVSNPFTIEFDVKKNNYYSAGTLSAKVYNLSPGSRESIRLDQAFDLGLAPEISLSAGTKDSSPLIFRGVMTSCYTTKEGANIVTYITAFDNGVLPATSRRAYRKGTPKQTIIDDLISDLSVRGISRGVVAVTPGMIERGLSINMATADFLTIITEGNFWIDNMRANVTTNDFVPPSTIKKIDSSRIINTPVAQSTQLFFDVLFKPEILIGQKLELESKINPHFNGPVTIISLGHKGTISDSVKSSVITNIGAKFNVGDNIFKRLNS